MIFYRGYAVKFEDYGRFRIYDPSRSYETVAYEDSFESAKTYIDFLYYLKGKIEQVDTREEQ